MKILIVRTHPTSIKINNYNVQEIGLARALVKKGHVCDVVFFTEGESRQEEIVINDAMKICVYWEHGINFLWQGVYNFKHLISITKKYDVIQVNEYNQIASYIIAKSNKEKCVIYHGPYYNQNDVKYNFLNKVFDLFFLRKMRMFNINIIAKSILAENTLKKKGFSNVITVGVGLDIQRFGAGGDYVEYMKRSKTLLYVGELSERRNTLFLLEVFDYVLKRVTNIKLMIVGKFLDKDYKNSCINYIKENDLERHVQIIESLNQSELVNYYKKATVFLFPTNYDIFGMVLLEAMYFGVPVVSSENGGSNTLIKDNDAGIVVPDFEVKKWGEVIANLLNDDEKRLAMAKIGRSKIESEFTWDAISDKFLDIYQNIKV